MNFVVTEEVRSSVETFLHALYSWLYLGYDGSGARSRLLTKDTHTHTHTHTHTLTHSHTHTHTHTLTHRHTHRHTHTYTHTHIHTHSHTHTHTHTHTQFPHYCSCEPFCGVKFSFQVLKTSPHSVYLGSFSPV